MHKNQTSGKKNPAQRFAKVQILELSGFLVIHI
jgi:hypothetical protein